MASAISTEEPPQEQGRPFYCHHCSHQWMKAQDSLFECPQCGQGFIEEVTEDFQPTPATPPMFPRRSPFLNFFLFPNDIMDRNPERPTAAARMSTGGSRGPRVSTRSRSRASRMAAVARENTSRSRSPHVSLVLESNNGNSLRIGINTGASGSRASANRFLSVAIDDIMESIFPPGMGSHQPAMNEEQLEQLPKVTITEAQVREQELMCSICFDDFVTDETENRKLPCEHIFHEKCIFPWLKTNASCPVCRTKLPNANPAAGHGDTEEFDSLLRVISEYQRNRQGRSRNINALLPNLASSSTSDESDTDEGPGQQSRRRVVRVGLPHPSTQRTAGPRSRVQNPLQDSFNETPAAVRRMPSVRPNRRQEPSSGPSTSAAALATASSSRHTTSSARTAGTAPQLAPSLDSDYRTARGARLIARNRIAEMSGSAAGSSARSVSTTNAAGGQFQNERGRPARVRRIASPRPQPSQIPLPVWPHELPRRSRYRVLPSNSGRVETLELYSSSSSSSASPVPRPPVLRRRILTADSDASLSLESVLVPGDSDSFSESLSPPTRPSRRLRLQTPDA